MLKPLTNIAYVDNTNLYKGAQAEGFKIDYVRFRTYLRERLGVKTAYMFIGFLPKNANMYKYFQESGYTIIFKPTVPFGDGGVKGNCDGELILQATCDFYEKKMEKAVIVTSDGDFSCLVKFLQSKDSIEIVLSPRGKVKCSNLLKESGVKITFLPEVRTHIEQK